MGWPSAAEQRWPTPECGGLPGFLPRVDKSGAQIKEPEVYFMGIIDILQEFNKKKALEGILKTLKHSAIHIVKRSDYASEDNAVSSVSAACYGTRFMDFLAEHLE